VTLDPVPSVPLLLAALAVVTVGAIAYLLLIELGKYWFYRSYRATARFTTYHRLRR
jgi:hypothetical protein